MKLKREKSESARKLPGVTVSASTASTIAAFFDALYEGVEWRSTSQGSVAGCFLGLVFS